MALFKCSWVFSTEEAHGAGTENFFLFIFRRAIFCLREQIKEEKLLTKTFLQISLPWSNHCNERAIRLIFFLLKWVLAVCLNNGCKKWPSIPSEARILYLFNWLKDIQWSRIYQMNLNRNDRINDIRNEDYTTICIIIIVTLNYCTMMLLCVCDIRWHKTTTKIWLKEVASHCMVNIRRTYRPENDVLMLKK